MPNKRKTAIQRAREKRLKLRDGVFPEAVDEHWFPLGNDAIAGYHQIPRLLPYVLAVMQESEGPEDPSRTYLTLLLRDVDTGLVENSDEELLGYESGYWTTRKKRTWQERLRRLEELGFVRTAPMGTRTRFYLFIRDPHLVLVERYLDGKISEGLWNAIVRRALEIGLAPSLEEYQALVNERRDRQAP
jgi:hypothetical protein